MGGLPTNNNPQKQGFNFVKKQYLDKPIYFLTFTPEGP